MIKETLFETKEKRKQKSNNDSFQDMDKNIDYRKRSGKVDTGNSIKYFDTLKNSESQGALEKSQLQSQSKTDNNSSEMKDMDMD